MVPNTASECRITKSFLACKGNTIPPYIFVLVTYPMVVIQEEGGKFGRLINSSNGSPDEPSWPANHSPRPV